MASIDKDNQFRLLQSEVKHKDRLQSKVLIQTQDKLDEIHREITYREKEINDLRQQIRDRERACGAAAVSDQLSKQNAQRLEAMGQSKDQEIENLKQELFETQKKLDNMVLSRKSEGTALLQVEHYKMDNERLIKLLASTKEFKNFAEFANDSGLNVRYLDPEKTESKKSSGEKQKTKA